MNRHGHATAGPAGPAGPGASPGAQRPGRGHESVTQAGTVTMAVIPLLALPGPGGPGPGTLAGPEPRCGQWPRMPPRPRHRVGPGALNRGRQGGSSSRGTGTPVLRLIGLAGRSRAARIPDDS
jgi:hypothetical protein